MPTFTLCASRLAEFGIPFMGGGAAPLLTFGRMLVAANDSMFDGAA